MTLKPLVASPGDIWHRTRWTLYKTANRIAEVRLTWPSLPETGGHTHIPVKCSEANLRQIKKQHFDTGDPMLWGPPHHPQRNSEGFRKPWRCLWIRATSSYNLTRSIWTKPSPKVIEYSLSTFNTSSIFLSLISLFSTFQVTVMANQNEIFCSNMEGVVSLRNFPLTHSAFNS